MFPTTNGALRHSSNRRGSVGVGCSPMVERNRLSCVRLYVCVCVCAIPIIYKNPACRILQARQGKAAEW
ncbi:hypothetical protein LY76DRAFT_65020 [Colletotrichum caudatum]|nr:hypothetical protein LY76DRAFT_65020 [Colletotrichum caudatum]